MAAQPSSRAFKGQKTNPKIVENKAGSSTFYVGIDNHLKDESYKFSEWSASCMALNSTGEYCLLAGRRGFALADMSKSDFHVKKLSKNYKWDPTAVEWNPHHTTEETFAAAMSQKVELWKVMNGTFTPDLTLKGHTRGISDLNWNRHDPNLLLTCSMDTYLYLWDLRECRRPAQVFTAVAGSSQIKWNKLLGNIFASAHDGDIRIWDTRKGNSPLVYITGHLSKIHGIDWSPSDENFLVTASSDETVKFWDITMPKAAKNTIRSGSPVWRARYTPFGDGIVTAVVPQFVRSQNSVMLWNTSNVNNPVHTFAGHSDVVLEFQWRSKEINGEMEYQLVTWSKDQYLKLWALSEKTLKACRDSHGSTSSDILSNGSTSRKNSIVQSPTFQLSPTLLSPNPIAEDLLDIDKLSEILGPRMVSNTTAISKEEAKFIEKNHIDHTKKDDKRKLSLHKKLEQEFALINVNNPILHFNELNAEKRYSSVAITMGQYNADLFICFPPAYPDNVQPVFQFSSDSNIDEDLERMLLKSLNDVSMSHVRHNRTCFEPCLRSLVQIFEDSMLNLDAHLSSDFQTVSRYSPQIKNTPFSSYEHSNIPIPRTSGARFCGVDKLVYFTRPPVINSDGMVGAASSNKRCLAALSGYTSNALDEAFSTPAFGNAAIFGKTFKQSVFSVVYVSDVSSLIPLSEILATNYILQGENPSTVALQNGNLAKKANRPDLVKAWSLLATLTDRKISPRIEMDFTPYPSLPFGRNLVKSLFEYYVHLRDVQTLAMFSCFLSAIGLPDLEVGRDGNKRNPGSLSTFSQLYNGNQDSNRARVSVTDGPQPSPEFPYRVTSANLSRHGSWSPPAFVVARDDSKENLRKTHHENCRLLCTDEERHYEKYKKAYADILFRWRALNKRAEIMTYVHQMPETHVGLDLALQCTSCNLTQRDPQCIKCRRLIAKCSVCRISVKGLLSFCVACGHGGHARHLLDWFQESEVCATGCGCNCLENGYISDLNYFNLSDSKRKALAFFTALVFACITLAVERK